MVVLLSNANIIQALEQVEQDKTAMLVIGLMRHICDGSLIATVNADTWPDYNALCISNLGFKDQKDVLKFREDAFTVYAPKTKLLQLEWLREITPLDLPCIRFEGFRSHLLDPLRKVYEKLGRHIFVVSAYLYWVESPKDLPVCELPKGYEQTDLTKEDAAIVNANWKFGRRPETEQHFYNCLSHYPATAVKNSQGNIVAGLITYHTGHIGALWVDSEHRSRGLAKFVTVDLARKLFSLGRNVIVCIETDHDVSMRLHEKCGFKRMEDQQVMWLRAQTCGKNTFTIDG